jgi:hypothetical protein
MKAKIEALYLDYVNNWLMVASFAEHHNIPTQKAYRIIEIGRKLNNRRAV